VQQEITAVRGTAKRIALVATLAAYRVPWQYYSGVTLIEEYVLIFLQVV